MRTKSIIFKVSLDKENKVVAKVHEKSNYKELAEEILKKAEELAFDDIHEGILHEFSHNQRVAELNYSKRDKEKITLKFNITDEILIKHLSDKAIAKEYFIKYHAYKAIALLLILINLSYTIYLSTRYIYNWYLSNHTLFDITNLFIYSGNIFKSLGI